MTTNWTLIFLAVLFLALVALVPKWQCRRTGRSESEQISLENDLRRTLVQILGAIGVAAGVWLAGIDLVDTRKEFSEGLRHTQEQLRITQEKLELGREEVRVARFTTAVKLLGDPSAEARLGGIYSLEQLSKDDPANYRTTTLEVLTAFVRSNIGVSSASGAGSNGIAFDVQVALAVIGRRTPAPKEERLDLSAISLAGIKLRGARLSNVDLSRSNLTNADLSGAELDGALLTDAIMHKTVLADSSMRGVKLYDVALTGANLQGADLSYSELLEVDLTGADLQRAKLAHAVLHKVKLEKVNLDEAEFYSADLSQAEIDPTLLAAACVDESTRLPEGMDRPRINPDCRLE